MFKNIRYDFPASIVVFLVALPLCLGIALASGAPLFSGIIAGMVGGIVVSLISGSTLSVSGPAAGLTAIVLSSIAACGTYPQFLVAVVLAGVFQLVFGLIKAGAVANYIPSNVIKGMLAAIGVILILKQIPHAFGYDKDAEGDFAFFQVDNENTFSEIYNHINHIDFGTTIIAVISLIILFTWDKSPLKKYKFIPAPLVVVALGILINQVYILTGSPLVVDGNHLVTLPKASSFTEFLGFFTLPDWATGLNNKAVWISAITIALVASIESLLCLEAVDKIDPEKRVSPTNRELIAQGIGNVTSGFLGGIPITSVIVRSSANVDAGAKSQTSAFLHGILLFVAVIFIPNLLSLIPLSALAAVLLATGYKLAKVSIFKEMWEQGKYQFVPFVVTVLAIVFTDLLIGIGVGILTSIFWLLMENLRKPYEFISEKYHAGEIIRIDLSEEVSFLNKASLNLGLENLPTNSKVQINASKSNFIDHDILEIIKDFEKSKAPARNIELSLVGFKEQYKILNNINFLLPPSAETQSNLKPTEILNLLKEGNKRLVENKRINRDITNEIVRSAKGLYPLATILSCIDSRTSSELIFDAGIGELMSIRIAGNIVNDDIIGSMEFSSKVLGSKLLVVLGHTHCGAIKSACDCVDAGSNINGMLEKVKSAINLDTITPTADRNSKNYEYVQKVADNNVLMAIEEVLTKSEIIRTLIAEDKLEVIGGMYDISTGKVTFFEDKAVDSRTLRN